MVPSANGWANKPAKMESALGRSQITSSKSLKISAMPSKTASAYPDRESSRVKSSLASHSMPRLSKPTVHNCWMKMPTLALFHVEMDLIASPTSLSSKKYSKVRFRSSSFPVSSSNSDSMSLLGVSGRLESSFKSLPLPLLSFGVFDRDGGLERLSTTLNSPSPPSPPPTPPEPPPEPPPKMEEPLGFCTMRGRSIGLLLLFLLLLLLESPSLPLPRRSPPPSNLLVDERESDRRRPGPPGPPRSLPELPPRRSPPLACSMA
mmetsp:Transcript_9827/g.28373  ORF Transcript_9827/g.28373 Transcript_9827/m.28373 type:complete len:262 (-) Transcript_9827:1226-2011(-)